MTATKDTTHEQWQQNIWNPLHRNAPQKVHIEHSSELAKWQHLAQQTQEDTSKFKELNLTFLA